jgi:phosphatidylserine/phosphatidylglycerophosphate/cardiolipin synthase-like enzyme
VTNQASESSREINYIQQKNLYFNNFYNIFYAEDDSKIQEVALLYVHSRGMVVDDEFMLIGSTNINQRSLEGSKDTEITMGAYQPHYTWARKHAHPHGQVFLSLSHTHTPENYIQTLCFNYLNSQ